VRREEFLASAIKGGEEYSGERPEGKLAIRGQGGRFGLLKEKVTVWKRGRARGGNSSSRREERERTATQPKIKFVHKVIQGGKDLWGGGRKQEGKEAAKGGIENQKSTQDALEVREITGGGTYNGQTNQNNLRKAGSPSRKRCTTKGSVAGGRRNGKVSVGNGGGERVKGEDGRKGQGACNVGRKEGERGAKVKKKMRGWKRNFTPHEGIERWTREEQSRKGG